VTVPEEAQQALIFLAPETGGDFSTLRKAVKNRPGTFVRAVQDLQAASGDRMRWTPIWPRSRNIANRPHAAQGTRRESGPEPGHQARSTVL